MLRRSAWRGEFWPWLTALCLALLVTVLAMDGASDAVPLNPDASRHALNGALLLDMVRDGGLASPVSYTERYYQHFPAISIPYHPPLFPLFESVIYALFGVSTFSARLAVALCTGAAFLLIFAVARRAGLPPIDGLAATLAVFAVPLSRQLATDVMLEFPSLVVATAAVLLIQRSVASSGYSGLAAAGLLTGAAIWTKQSTLFVAAIPGCLMWMRRDWSMLKHWRFWFFHLSASIAFLSILGLARLANVSNAGWQHTPLWARIPHHAAIYANGIWSILKPAAACVALSVLLVVIVLRLRGRFRNLDVPLAWLATSVALLLVIPPWDPRYLFYSIPPLAIVVMHAIGTAMRVAGAPTTLAGAVLVALSASVFLLPAPSGNGEGIGRAARIVAAAKPSRVLVLSQSFNGAFTFEFRANQGDLHTRILRGHGLDRQYFEPDRFPALLREYGIEYVVIEDGPHNHAYEAILSGRDERLLPVAVLPLGTAASTIHVLKFLGPVLNPPSDLFESPSELRRRAR